ncbi:MAG: UbiA family prenyltransferase [Parcubacteria group bacterium]|nr:UbiA family prenyltransferase [Parcubacteria group bacterium]
MKKYRYVISYIKNEFVYAGHLQALGAASIVFASSVLFNTRIHWSGILVAYLVFYSAYIFDRFKGLKTDSLTNSERTQHILTYKRKIPVIIASVGLFTLILLLYFSNFYALLVAIGVITLGLFYDSFFKKITKKITAFKNFYVALPFAVMVLFPFIFYSHPLTKEIGYSVIIFFSLVLLKMFLLQVFLDIKDIDSDKQQGLRTVPVIIGENNTFKLLKIANIIITFLILSIFLYKNILPKFSLILLLTIPFDFYSLKISKQDKYKGYVLVSMGFILWFILIGITKILI